MSYGYEQNKAVQTLPSDAMLGRNPIVNGSNQLFMMLEDLEKMASELASSAAYILERLNGPRPEGGIQGRPTPPGPPCMTDKLADIRMRLNAAMGSVVAVRGMLE